MLDSQNFIADNRIGFGIIISHFTANHICHQCVFIGFCNIAGGDVGAVTNDRHSVANLKNFFQTVTDVYNSQSVGLQLWMI